MKKVEIFDPTTQPIEDPISFSPRPQSLRNACVGLVDNTKHNSDRLLLKIAAIMEQDYEVRDHVILRKNKAGEAANDTILSKLKAECDVIVAGIGD